ncbi:protein Lines homolog 1 isoform X2 [Hemiscyllium ocellatum]|uniref:protein Lines homolog 1 isoform X2 n=1 Tax=Hemiscyllium ocellatum TaxID=170820 RepID=UPI0029662C07|nr:protein Lines homolog 1 isoform X2 [Hemiscyllium ocellatum]
MMGKCLPRLHQFYKELLAEERPSEDIPKLAALLSPSVCMGDPNIFSPTNESSNETYRFSRGTVTSDSYSMPHDSNSTPNDSQNEISLIQISLIQMMCSKIFSEDLNEDVRESYVKTLRILLEDMELLSKLVLLFGHPDKLLSHLAVKSVASLILVEILVMDLSVESWISSYLYALSEDPGNSQAAEWVQTITLVIKEVLKRKSLNKAVIIEKFLTPMDSVFSGLYSFMFTSYSDDCQTIGATTGPDTENIATTNQLVFVDLLEIFVSIRIQLKLNFPCLRILYLRTSQLLQYVVSSAHYLVKKRLLVLLKQCVLCHASESNVNDSSCATSEQDIHMQHDLLAVSNAVLQALVSGQFRELAVSPKPCFFGGNEVVGVVDSNCGPDLVMIRAVCLILIKAMEIKVQTRTFDVTEQVFGEQDDDMVEAARALLTIYISCYRSLDIYPQENANNSCEACEHCFNPHCIFLLILQSLVFDHSVLLDFLISTETCFLEYLVRYLRLLQEDWRFFCCICAQFDEAAAAESFCCSEINEICDDFSLIPPVEQDRTNNQIVTENSKEAVVTPTTPHFLTPVRDPRNNVDTVKSSNSGHLMSSNRPWPCEQPRSLVDYESSEDSDNEVMEASCLNILSLDTNQGIVTNNTLTIGETVKHDPEAISIKVVRNPREIKSHSCENNTKMPLERIFKKSVSCLTELRKTISRLQRRNLFPYNATALLKLLSDIETRSRRD